MVEAQQQKVKRYLCFVLLAVMGLTYGVAQKIAVKTNALYDATTTMNVGAEVALTARWTMDVSGSYNPWTFSNNKMRRLWMVQPEGRYWFCEKFNGHFMGVQLHGGEFNVGNYDTSISFLGTNLSGLKEYRYEGWFVGAGVGYGYSWILGEHWNFEAEIAVGYAYMKYDKYKCQKCGEKVESNKSHNYIGPTKAALNLVYVF